MPYVIVAVVLIVGSLAFFALRSPVEAPTQEPVAQPAATPELPDPGQAPEGFVEPTEPPPNSTPEPDPTTPEPVTTGSADDDEDDDFDPADDQRTFSAEASYLTPKRTSHDIMVTLTLKDRVVVDANVTYDGGAAVTPNHSAFDATYRDEVVGKTLNEINLSRVGGASLTTAAFNEAVADIRGQG